MQWLTGLPTFFWLRLGLVAALLVVLLAGLMAVKPRSKRNRSKPI